ncbi:DUF4259 domain-containing protein [Arthrobacter sp. TMN-37]
MGSWGTEIFDNDDALDVRGDFEEHLAEGATPEEATARICRDFGLDDDAADSRGADDNNAWLALAAVHHGSGYSSREVVARALAIIESRDELERWFEEDRPARAAALAGFGRALQDATPGVRPQRTSSFRERVRRLRRMPWWARLVVAALIAVGFFLLLRVLVPSVFAVAMWPLFAFAAYTGRTIRHRFIVPGGPAKKVDTGN